MVSKSALSCRTPLLDLGQSRGPSFSDMNKVNCYMLSSRLSYYTLHTLLKPRQICTLNLYRTMSSSTTSQSINQDIVSRVSLESRVASYSKLKLTIASGHVWSIWDGQVYLTRQTVQRPPWTIRVLYLAYHQEPTSWRGEWKGIPFRHQG